MEERPERPDPVIEPVAPDYSRRLTAEELAAITPATLVERIRALLPLVAERARVGRGGAQARRRGHRADPRHRRVPPLRAASLRRPRVRRDGLRRRDAAPRRGVCVDELGDDVLHGAQPPGVAVPGGRAGGDLRQAAVRDRAGVRDAAGERGARRRRLPGDRAVALRDRRHARRLGDGHGGGHDEPVRRPLVPVPDGGRHRLRRLAHGRHGGDGSNDVAVEDVFVPADRALSFQQMGAGTTPGGLLHDNPMYRVAITPFLAIASAIPIIGAAKGVVERCREDLPSRVSFGIAQMDRPAVLMALGQAATDVELAEVSLRQSVRDLMRLAESDDRGNVGERARIRANVVNAVTLSRDCARRSSTSSARPCTAATIRSSAPCATSPWRPATSSTTAPRRWSCAVASCSACRRSRRSSDDRPTRPRGAALRRVASETEGGPRGRSAHPRRVRGRRDRCARPDRGRRRARRHHHRGR